MFWPLGPFNKKHIDNGRKNHDIFLSTIIIDIGRLEFVGFQTSSISYGAESEIVKG
jgi:hypothetical protein